jgi:hypothetical protein
MQNRLKRMFLSQQHYSGMNSKKQSIRPRYQVNSRIDSYAGHEGRIRANVDDNSIDPCSAQVQWRQFYKAWASSEESDLPHLLCGCDTMSITLIES